MNKILATFSIALAGTAFIGGCAEKTESAPDTAAAVDAVAAQSVETPRFSARCVTEDNVFILVSDPSKTELYFAREDGMYNASKIVELKVSDDLISGKELYAFEGFEDSQTRFVEFDRKTGELRQIRKQIDRDASGAPIGESERITKRACEPKPTDVYADDLAQVTDHIQRELELHAEKSATAAAAAEAAKAEDEARQKAPNKF